MNKAQALYRQAKKLIPGGTQLLSKRPEMLLPGLWPTYYIKAKGCEVWDINGKKYVDMSYMGIGSCVLGYADDSVDNAVKKAIDKGSMSTLNSPEEVELARLLCDIHPWAQMVRFARTGGEAVAIAVRIARAKTGRDVILFCGYHGWSDWYLSANLADDKALDGHLLPGLMPKGVPRGLKGLAFPFRYNELDEFMRLIKIHKDNTAAIVMEPIRNSYPKPAFLETIKKTAKKLGIILIFDEITSGWRLTSGGAHLTFRVFPDMAVFAKAISNGFPMSVVIGKRGVMQAAEESFISSTYWTERIGPVAALATIKKLRDNKVHQHLIATGKIVQSGWLKYAKKLNLKVAVYGIYPLSYFSFICKDPLVVKTLFTQLMLERGFLATNAFYASYAHKNSYIKNYLNALDDSFNFIAKALKEDRCRKYLKGDVCHSGFKRLA